MTGIKTKRGEIIIITLKQQQKQTQTFFLSHIISSEITTTATIHDFTSHMVCACVYGICTVMSASMSLVNEVVLFAPSQRSSGQEKCFKQYLLALKHKIFVYVAQKYFFFFNKKNWFLRYYF